MGGAGFAGMVAIWDVSLFATVPGFTSVVVVAVQLLDRLPQPLLRLPQPALRSGGSAVRGRGESRGERHRRREDHLPGFTTSAEGRRSWREALQAVEGAKDEEGSSDKAKARGGLTVPAVWGPPSQSVVEHARTDWSTNRSPHQSISSPVRTGCPDDGENYLWIIMMMPLLFSPGVFTWRSAVRHILSFSPQFNLNRIHIHLCLI